MSEIENLIAEALYVQYNHTPRTWGFLSKKEKSGWDTEARTLIRTFKMFDLAIVSKKAGALEADVLPFVKKPTMTVLEKEPA